MHQLRIVFALLLLSILFVAPTWAGERLRLATTTSTENSGLLAVLLPPFELVHDCKVDVIAVGTGKAIKLGEAGDVDVVMVHDQANEEKFVAAGYGVERRDLMYNDFVLLGPNGDPAGVHGTADIAEALKKIAASGTPFVSRGDLSGTHGKEKELWRAASIVPGGVWYLEAGLGMGEVITMAGERQGYTLSDRGTWIAFAAKNDLRIVAEGDQRLFNPYGLIVVNPERHPHVKGKLGEAFVDFLLSEEGQKLISGFTVNGQQLFFTY